MLSGWNRRRREIDAAYRTGIVHPRVRPIPVGGGDVVHLAVYLADDRSSLRSHLHERGITTDIHYPQPDYAAPPGGFAPMPHTEAACNRVLTLPCFPEMTGEEVDRVIAGVNSWRA
jgi:dTDP-4-amino-4,6-dideoxygalactose transaminase